MHELPILAEIVTVFIAALAVILLSHRLRVPALVGFLLAGVLIGPYGLALVEDTAHVQGFAELAVVLMLFIIGLELSLAELRHLGRRLLVGGSLQALVTTTAAVAVARALGATWAVALFAGFVITLSSTALVLKLLADRRETEAPHGRMALAILLFQDLLIVPMLLVVPVLAGGDGGQGLALYEVLLRFGEGLAVVAGVLVAGRLLMPRLLGLLARTGIRELLLLAALASCLGAALLTHHLGLSMALGGFLAGVALAESDLRFQVQAEIAPFRDVFNSIFFTSIGMLLSLSFVAAHLPAILALTAGILVAKAFIVFAVIRLLGMPLRPALAGALALCQIGEFSFVLLSAGRGAGLVDAGFYALFIAASVLTMLVTPAALAVASPLAAWIAERWPARAGGDEEAAEALSGHVVIGGWGINGRQLARVLREAGVSYRVVEIDPMRVRAAQAEGVSILFGDISRRDLQLVAGVERASVAVLALADPEATRRAVRLARSLNPDLHLLVRTHAARHMDELLRLGADAVVAQDLETSIELTRRVLGQLRLPRQLIRVASRLLHEDHYQALLAPRPRTGLSRTLLDVLAAGTVEAFPLTPGHWAVGRTVRQLDLRRATGVTILAVLRGDEVLAHPDPDETLAEGDLLALAGDHGALAAALDYLEAPAPAAAAEAGAAGEP